MDSHVLDNIFIFFSSVTSTYKYLYFFNFIFYHLLEYIPGDQQTASP